MILRIVPGRVNNLVMLSFNRILSPVRRGGKPKLGSERAKEDTQWVVRTVERDLRFIADEKTACSNP